MERAKQDTGFQLLISENKFFSHEIVTEQEESIVSAFVKRSFSVMRRIKTWLRSTITDNNLNKA